MIDTSSLMILAELKAQFFSDLFLCDGMEKFHGTGVIKFARAFPSG